MLVHTQALAHVRTQTATYTFMHTPYPCTHIQAQAHTHTHTHTFSLLSSLSLSLSLSGPLIGPWLAPSDPSISFPKWAYKSLSREQGSLLRGSALCTLCLETRAKLGVKVRQMSVGSGVTLGLWPPLLQKQTAPNRGPWLLTMERCARNFPRPPCEKETKPNLCTFFFRPGRGPRRGARTTAFFSGVKSWVERRELDMGPTGSRPIRGPARASLPCALALATCSPGHWSSLTRRSFLSSPPQMETCWLDPGRWRPFEFVLRPTSKRGAAQMDQQLRKALCLMEHPQPRKLSEGEEPL